MSAPWPPPPDLESLQDLVRVADPEGLLAAGAPADEYEPEEEALLAALQPLSSADLTPDRILPLLTTIWESSFGDRACATREPALRSLAAQIAHFFGPEAEPQIHS